MCAEFDSQFLSRFGAFTQVGSLHSFDLESVPDEPGVYVVALPTLQRPRFLETSTGGRFKGKNPRVSTERLQAKWVDGTRVLYVGKASRLRLRIWQLVGFAYGTRTPHWGGRYLWQLSGREGLLVGWRLTTKASLRKVESGLLAEFKAHHGGHLPFANLKS